MSIQDSADRFVANHFGLVFLTGVIGGAVLVFGASIGVGTLALEEIASTQTEGMSPADAKYFREGVGAVATLATLVTLLWLINTGKAPQEPRVVVGEGRRGIALESE